MYRIGFYRNRWLSFKYGLIKKPFFKGLFYSLYINPMHKIKGTRLDPFVGIRVLAADDTCNLNKFKII